MSILGGSRFFEPILECWYFGACFTIECGSPGILKSMSSSILSRIVSLSVLTVLISWYTSGSSCTATLLLSSCPDLSWVCSTLRLLLSSDERAWTPITYCVIPSRLDPARIGFGIGWDGWKNFACRATSPPDCWTTSLLVVDQLSNPILVQSWRGYMYTISFKTFPVFIPTTFRIQ